MNVYGRFSPIRTSHIEFYRDEARRCLPTSVGSKLWGRAATSSRGFLILAIALACGAAGCFPVPPDIPSSPKEFNPRQIEGTWYIAATNFPTWLSGKNTEALLSYKIRPAAEGVVEMDDVVAFKSEGDPSSYVGFDTQDPASDSHFTWRGNGLLALFPTEWYVAKVGPKGDYIITYYGDTVVSSDSVDVMTKSPNPSPETVNAALKAIEADPILKAKAHGLKRVFLYRDEDIKKSLEKKG